MQRKSGRIKKAISILKRTALILFIDSFIFDLNSDIINKIKKGEHFYLHCIIIMIL